MKQMRFTLIILALVIGSYAARAQREIIFLATGGARAAYDQLIPSFESKTGYKVNVTYESADTWRQKITQGVAFDVVSMPLYPEVAVSDNVIPSSEKTLAVIAMGVALRKGAQKPDISTPEAVKKMLLSARSISYNNGYAGVSMDDTLKKLGIFDQMQTKIIRSKNSADMMKKVADGEAEFGFTYISELYSGAQGLPPEQGIEPVGALPKEISDRLIMVGFVSSHARHPAAARAFLDYISSPEAASAYTTHHMEPGH